MSQVDNIIDAILAREGPPTNDPLDKGGSTAYGISQRANPEAWKNGPPTEAQARAIYEARYFKGPGFDKVEDGRLQAQLTDFGVNSGPAVAVRKLQEILGVPGDGILGPDTLNVVNHEDARGLNNKLAVARVLMLARIVANNPLQVKFLVGWLARAAEWIS